MPGIPSALKRKRGVNLFGLNQPGPLRGENVPGAAAGQLFGGAKPREGIGAAGESAARKPIDWVAERRRLLATSAVSKWRQLRTSREGVAGQKPVLGAVGGGGSGALASKPAAFGGLLGGAPSGAPLPADAERARFQAIKERFKILRGSGTAAKAGAISAFEKSEGAARINAAIALERARQLPLNVAKKLRDLFVQRKFSAAYQQK
ncbi:MAG: hypothetical protein WC792_03780 [Candidatus Micrarchaeia archaeon]|jgi:hypothetical protein